MVSAREEEGTRPQRANAAGPASLDHRPSSAPRRDRASVTFGPGAEVLLAGSARTPTLLRLRPPDTCRLRATTARCSRPPGRLRRAFRRCPISATVAPHWSWAVGPATGLLAQDAHGGIERRPRAGAPLPTRYRTVGGDARARGPSRRTLRTTHRPVLRQDTRRACFVDAPGARPPSIRAAGVRLSPCWLGSA